MKARDSWSIHDLVVDTKDCVSRRVDTDANLAERVAPYLMRLIVRTSKRALFATAL
jgi:hypothetical protein